VTEGGAGARVLVVDDEPAIVRALRPNLERHGFQVDVAETAAAALGAYQRHRPDIVLLDLGLPDRDGLDVVRRLRAQSNTPIVILSVRGAEQDKVAALELGADDYVTKPFGVEELLARIRVALRHAAGPTSGAAAVVRVGNIEADFEKRRVTLEGGEIHLTPTEWELLKAFLSHPDRVLTDQMLLRQVWGAGYTDEGHYLHVYVARLRKKIESDPQRPRHLITEPGVGYRMLAEPQVSC
jgi:two-component system KDP operon response regulator KdpE